MPVWGYITIGANAVTFGFVLYSISKSRQILTNLRMMRAVQEKQIRQSRIYGQR